MSTLARKAWLGLTRNLAYTTPDAEDQRLRGRTYAIPFEDVWQTALDLVSGELPGWSMVHADDWEGLIRATIVGRVERLASDFTVRIGLDRDAQTRVDAMSASVTAQRDLGTNAQRVALFFDAMDTRLGEILANRRAQKSGTA